MSPAPANQATADEESRRIKEKIIEAAGKLYEKKGLYETSVAEIAENAGISVPVTYHYVSRKSDILLLIMEAFTNKFHVRVLPELESLTLPVDKLKKAMEVYFRLVDEDAIKVILVYRKSRALDKEGRKKIMAAETAAVKVFSDIIEEGCASGAFQTADPDLAAYNILTAAHCWALKQWHFGRRFDLDEYTRVQTEYHLTALGA